MNDHDSLRRTVVFALASSRAFLSAHDLAGKTIIASGVGRLNIKRTGDCLEAFETWLYGAIQRAFMKGPH